jgi:hypothetical protein
MGPSHVPVPWHESEQHSPTQVTGPLQLFEPSHAMLHDGPKQSIKPRHEFVASVQSTLHGIPFGQERKPLQTSSPTHLMAQGTPGGHVTEPDAQPLPFAFESVHVIVQTLPTHVPGQTAAHSCAETLGAVIGQLIGGAGGGGGGGSGGGLGGGVHLP